jgi:urate oxidase
MPVLLTENRYGKSRVRLVKVERNGPRHNLKDLNVDIRLTGAFEESYTVGDNSSVVATDTMKNTVYALARQVPVGEIEEFGLRLADHFLSRNAHVSGARIAITENEWSRIHSNGLPHDHSFVQGAEKRTALIEQGIVTSGITGLVVLKTTRSAFEGYIHDEYTTLKETKDRLFGTAITAEWVYRDGKHAYGDLWRTVRQILLEVFAEHDSLGVQHTLHAMGESVLERIAEIEEIRISMPNRHCLLVDLAPFGLDNPNEVFVPTDEPHGIIEATLKRLATD